MRDRPLLREWVASFAQHLFHANVFDDLPVFQGGIEGTPVVTLAWVVLMTQRDRVLSVIAQGIDQGETLCLRHVGVEREVAVTGIGGAADLDTAFELNALTELIFKGVQCAELGVGRQPFFRWRVERDPKASEILEDGSVVRTLRKRRIERDDGAVVADLARE